MEGWVCSCSYAVTRRRLWLSDSATQTDLQWKAIDRTGVEKMEAKAR